MRGISVNVSLIGMLILPLFLFDIVKFRILLPFERQERDLRENGCFSKSELTISTIPKNNSSRHEMQSHRMTLNRLSATSPAIEIIPIKSNIAGNAEITLEQINDIQNIIKPKKYGQPQYFMGNSNSSSNSNDGMSVPFHVIVRSNAKNVSNFDSKRKHNDDSVRITSSSSSFGGQQKPKEKENIPLSFQKLSSTQESGSSFSLNNVIDLVDNDSEIDFGRDGGSPSQAKKRKLDILREGGLEVTPISRKSQESFQLTHSATNNVRSYVPHIMQPNVSLMSLTPMRAPPVIQSLNMYQSTRQVFKDPKEVFTAAKNCKPYCLDLSSKNYKNQQQSQQPPDYTQCHNATEVNQNLHNSQLSFEEMQNSYRGSNPDLQITLVRSQKERPSSSNSSYSQKEKHEHFVPKKPKNDSKQKLPAIPPLNPVIIAAANEFQKLQQQNMPFFPFLSGLDITPMQPNSGALLTKAGSSLSNALDQNLINYLSALYGNPSLLQGNNSLPSHAAEFMKIINNNVSIYSRVPSSKNK
jgi:hypothetical protein